MKKYILFFLAIAGSLNACASPADPGTKEANSFINAINIPLAGNAFQTAGPFSDAVTTKGIESWTQANTKYSLFFKSDKALNCHIKLLGSIDPGHTIRLTLGQTARTLVLDTKGELDGGEFSIPAGYQEIVLQGISKKTGNFAGITDLRIEINEDISSLSFVKDNVDNRFYWGRRGPSVHLTYTVPAGPNFKWMYNEVSIPLQMDPIGSYFMANGFGEGYFGMQVNSETERRILFSVWSPFVTDNPASIPEDQKIKLLKKGPQVYTGEFGNEGAGGQSYLRFPWLAGKTYQFLNSIAPDDQGNTVYTAYFKEKTASEWLLIAQFLRPKTSTWYKRPHSFVENFDPLFGYLTRKATYLNPWLVDANGQWVELQEVKLTGDDIARRAYRQDYDGGIANNLFFLQNGGFFNSSAVLNSMSARPAQHVQPQIDFQKLP